MWGQGSGKTHVAADIAAQMVCDFPKNTGFIAANTYQQLHQSTLKRIFQVWRSIWGFTEYDPKGNPEGVYVVDKKPPEHFVTEGHDLKRYHNTITFRWGTLVFTGSLDNYKAHDGKEFGWAILDETKDTKEEAVKDVIVARLRERGIYKKDGVLTPDPTGKPLNPLWIITSPAKVDWLNEFFNLLPYHDEIIEKAVSKTDYFCQETRPGFKTIVASTYHNEKNLPEGYIETRAKGVNKNTILMNIYGVPFAQTGGESFSSFDMGRNTGEVKHEYDPDKALHLSFDFNVVPYMTLKVFQIFEQGEGWRVIGLPEICPKSPNNTTAGACKQFLKRYSNHKGGVYVTGDPSGKQRDTRAEKGRNDFDIIRQELKSLKPIFRVARKAPNVVPRITFMNGIFAGETNITYIEDRNNSHTINDYIYIKEAPDGSKMKTRVKDPDTLQTYEKYGHTSDATEYFFCQFFDGEYARYSGKRKVSIA